jgi:hypothetical protein
VLRAAKHWKGAGCCDGEQAERLWSSLRNLATHLRECGDGRFRSSFDSQLASSNSVKVAQLPQYIAKQHAKYMVQHQCSSEELQSKIGMYAEKGCSEDVVRQYVQKQVDSARGM